MRKIYMETLTLNHTKKKDQENKKELERDDPIADIKN